MYLSMSCATGRAAFRSALLVLMLVLYGG